MRTHATVLGALAAAVTLAACGSAKEESSATRFKGEKRAVAQAVEDLQSAAEKGDAKRICGRLLAKALRESAVDCVRNVDKSLEDASSFELTVERIGITGAKATARVKARGKDGKDERDTLDLVKEGGAWRIASLGG